MRRRAIATRSRRPPIRARREASVAQGTGASARRIWRSAYYGLAVALDREGQTVAAREMMRAALAHDPAAAVLKAASQAGPGGDLFFVPDGDVFYYLGLAAEAEGRGRRCRGRVSGVPGARAARAAGRALPRAHLGTKKTRRRRARQAAAPAGSALRVVGARDRVGDGADRRAADRRRVAGPAADPATSAWTRRAAAGKTRQRPHRDRARASTSAASVTQRHRQGCRAGWTRAFARASEGRRKERLRFPSRREPPHDARTEFVLSS